MFVVNRSVVAFAQSALRCTEFSYVLFGLNAPDKLLLNSFTPSPALLAPVGPNAAAGSSDSAADFSDIHTRCSTE